MNIVNFKTFDISRRARRDRDANASLVTSETRFTSPAFPASHRVVRARVVESHLSLDSVTALLSSARSAATRSSPSRFPFSASARSSSSSARSKQQHPRRGTPLPVTERASPWPSSSSSPAVRRRSPRRWPRPSGRVSSSTPAARRASAPFETPPPRGLFG